ncbi:MAG: anthranilate phosphoribosyltransferase [Flavobacteriaceae bacterium]
MKAILNQLIQHEQLTSEQARQVIINIADGKYNPSQIAAFLTVFMMRSISLEELEGFRSALLELCIAVDLSEFEAIDLCGTGGDEKNTFNISTLSAFVTAGAGVKVTKHGNYGVSSGCGSSNVLEALDIRFSNEADFLKRCMDEAGICILHAPLFHPAMKNVAPVRRELGVKTFFNMLGPLVNPAFPKYQLTGVFNLELARLYYYLFQKTASRFTVLYALDGYDEISLTGATKAFSNKGERVLTPQDFGVLAHQASTIAGGETVDSSAAIFTAILDNKGSQEQHNVVCANAGMAIATAKDLSPIEGFEEAKASLESGEALKAFKTLQKLSQS